MRRETSISVIIVNIISDNVWDGREDVLTCQGKCREGALYFGLIVNLMIPGRCRTQTLQPHSDKLTHMSPLNDDAIF